MVSLQDRNINALTPKELPTINIFCIYSIQTWFDLLKFISKTTQMFSTMNDFVFVILFILAGIEILVFIFDYYGTFWPQNSIYNTIDIILASAFDLLMMFSSLIWILKQKVYYNLNLLFIYLF